MKKLKTQSKTLQKGTILFQAFIFGTIAIVMIGALTSWAGTNIRVTRYSANREQALQIAEAGVDYYRWHLAHAPNDYKDGLATSTGPYVHSYYDKDGNQIGSFSLQITPPPTGFTLVKIKSTGTVLADPTISRSIFVELAIPSFAKYAVVANDNMRFGEGTEVFGPIHSNGGIRFDGLAHNIVSSATLSYDDPDHSGGSEFGVHTHLQSNGTVNNSFQSAEAPPSSVPVRNDVFQAGRQFPVPAVDFAGITSNLSQIKSNSQSSGKYFAASGVQGYHITLKTNDTFDIYKVNQLMSPPNGCSNTSSQTGWGTWSIRTTGSNNQTLVGNYAIPSNGLVFVEDNVWIDGQVQGARLTIAVGRFPDSPSTWRSVTINNDLIYSNYDGTDTIAIISQGNINVGLNSDDDLRIDTAMISQNGRVGRYHYDSNCGSSYIRNSITLDGMIGSALRYGFAYTDGTGYQTRNIIYDANLLYGPPPSFPLTSDQYQTIFWEEVK